MNFEDILKVIPTLSKDEVIKLFNILQTILQVESESKNINHEFDSQLTQNYDYEIVLKRILKSKPTNLKSLNKFISAMFQFSGGISINKINEIIDRMHFEKIITINNNKVIYNSDKSTINKACK
jgi:hypothetical protein